MHVKMNKSRSEVWSEPEPLEQSRAAYGDTNFPTPGEVFGEISVTLSIFLAVAFVANLLVAALGA